MIFRPTAVLFDALVKPPRQSFIGEVIGTKMQKTIKVRVAKTRIHPVVQKPVVIHKNFLAHDEESTCVVGDVVRIDSCNKLSRRKFFTLGEIVKPAARYVDEEGVLHTQKAAGFEPDRYEKAKESKGLKDM